MRRLFFPGLASLTLLAACATSPHISEQAPAPTAYAGFLSHPDRLQPVPGDSGAYRWSESDAKLAQYNRILLERIQVQLASDAAYKAMMEQSESDPEMRPEAMPFDGKRMIYGGFLPLIMEG